MRAGMAKCELERQNASRNGKMRVGTAKSELERQNAKWQHAGQNGRMRV